MTSHRDIHTKIDVKPEVLPGIQIGNGIPYDKCNLRGIAHAHTNRKDDIFTQRRLVQNFTFYIGVGSGDLGDLFIDEEHTALDIFRFALGKPPN